MTCPFLRTPRNLPSSCAYSSIFSSWLLITFLLHTAYPTHTSTATSAQYSYWVPHLYKCLLLFSSCHDSLAARGLFLPLLPRLTYYYPYHFDHRRAV
ncbi:hypothetical protein C8R43DRAFT_114383 [Mycena crocata]|nr:hypothetical protein C8R43DRAFT_114383 [Mycena crocata]